MTRPPFPPDSLGQRYAMARHELATQTRRGNLWRTAALAAITAHALIAVVLIAGWLL